MAYDDQNIFAKILRGEIPSKKVFENEYALAFHDINPQASVHVLVIPKGPFISSHDFGAEAPAELVTGFWRAVSHVAAMLEVDEAGYRLIANHRDHAHQEVPHFHVHIMGGRPLGPMLDQRFNELAMGG